MWYDLEKAIGDYSVSIPLHAMKMIPLVAPASEGISVGKRVSHKNDDASFGECPRTGKEYKTPAWKREQNRKWALENREAFREMQRRYDAKNRDMNNKKGRDRIAKNRSLIIQGYGGKCVCCEETRREFLALDHIHGGGGKERAEGLTTQHLCTRLIRDNFPRDKYRLLCHNCNQARGAYGYCPHSIEKLLLDINNLEKFPNVY
jgi:hypothetical protein